MMENHKQGTRSAKIGADNLAEITQNYLVDLPNWLKSLGYHLKKSLIGRP